MAMRWQRNQPYAVAHVQNNYIIIALWRTASIKTCFKPVENLATTDSGLLLALPVQTFTFVFNNSYCGAKYVTS